MIDSALVDLCVREPYTLPSRCWRICPNCYADLMRLSKIIHHGRVRG